MERLGPQPTHIWLSPKPLLCPLHNVPSRLMFLKIAFVQKSVQVVLLGHWGFSPNCLVQHLTSSFQLSGPTYPFNHAFQRPSWTHLLFPEHARVVPRPCLCTGCSSQPAVPPALLHLPVLLSPLHQSSWTRKDSTLSFKAVLMTSNNIPKLPQHFFFGLPWSFHRIPNIEVSCISKVHHVTSSWTHNVSDFKC